MANTTYGKQGRRRQRRQGARYAELQAVIVEVLQLKYRAMTVETDAGVLRRHGVTGRSSGIPDGFPDLEAYLPGGRHLCIEVKTGTGRQSKMQKLMQQQFKELGHEYVLARNVDDVIAAVERET